MGDQLTTAEASRRYGLTAGQLWAAARSGSIRQPTRLSQRRTTWAKSDCARLAKLMRTFMQANGQGRAA